MKVLFLDIDGVLNSQNWFGFMKYCEDNGTVEKVLNYVVTYA